MKLFNLKESKPNQANNYQEENNAAITILGSGCKKCNQLEMSTQEAMHQLHLDEPIGHVTEYAKIASYGVMSTPALVVDGKVLSYGKVLGVEEVKQLLAAARKLP